jgi:flagellar basal body-associated protein FliL
MARNGKNSPSVLNWMGTLILYSIPGLNVLFIILTAIFAKSTAKRRFAIAAILLMLLGVALIIAAFVVFPEFFNEVAQAMREGTKLPVTLPELTL